MTTTRRSFWRIHLARARTNGDWYEIPRLYTRLTAAQTATDIRNGRRITGIQPNEKWMVEWQSADDPEFDWACTLRIKLLETVNAESSET
jgi:hypothetical protein